MQSDQLRNAPCDIPKRFDHPQQHDSSRRCPGRKFRSTWVLEPESVTTPDSIIWVQSTAILNDEATQHQKAVNEFLAAVLPRTLLLNAHGHLRPLSMMIIPFTYAD